jgi:hypothetical protein
MDPDGIGFQSAMAKRKKPKQHMNKMKLRLSLNQFFMGNPLA